MHSAWLSERGTAPRRWAAIVAIFFAAVIQAACSQGSEPTESLSAQQSGDGCRFPDSSRGTAPDWLCGEAIEGWALQAVGSKSRVPSVSLQSRLAGRAATEALYQDLLTRVARRITAAISGEWNIERNAAVEAMSQVPALQSVAVVARAASPRRELYILVGLPEGELAAAEQAVLALIGSRPELSSLTEAQRDQLRQLRLN